ICTQHDFAVSRVQVEGDPSHRRKQSGWQQAKGHDMQWDDDAPSFEEAPASEADRDGKGIVALLVELRGTKSIPKLAARISEIPGVVSVQAGDASFLSE
ncbi:MAG TPA: hypothetical protein VKV96_07785, partial [Roseiarcus sp.]|nr:hypothetical protein [Roseiarcus sp.]